MHDFIDDSLVGVEVEAVENSCAASVSLGNIGDGLHSLFFDQDTRGPFCGFGTNPTLRSRVSTSNLSCHSELTMLNLSDCWLESRLDGEQ